VGSLPLIGVATPATPDNFDTTAGVYDRQPAICS